MSFLQHSEKESKSGVGKIIAALVVLAVAGGAAYWFLGRAPDVEPEPEAEAAPEVVEREAPPPEEEAPEPAPDLPSTGSLLVTANVEGAEVYVNGESKGRAPFEDAEFPIGMHEVRVTREGYEDFVDRVRVRPGSDASLRASLDLLPPSLRVESDVPGATVFLDRKYIGETPVNINNVSAGDHQLTVSAEGYDMYAETVSVTTGHKDVMVSFQKVVEAFEASVAVIHKHTFGDCKGSLIADANGIRYVTDHKDAFSAPYASLEQFEVDYIEKNLNLKIRGGRNYNFTEQSGNADALFVFHQSVQEFREKM